MALTQVELTGIDGSTGSIPLASIDSIKNSASLSNNIVLNADGTTTLTPSNIIKSGTAVASTSGTFVDFTGIPSWVKKITVMFDGVSTNGTSQPYLQLGDSGGVETTGYVGAVGSISTSANTTNASTSVTAAFALYSGTVSASEVIHGSVQISNLSGNVWTISGSLLSGARAVVIGGSKTLSATLDRIRLTTVNGTDTFDAGTINILFEG
jgi:hypothetical protein